MSQSVENPIMSRVNQYRWYHRIEVTEGIYTLTDSQLQGSWDFNLRAMDIIDFKGKRVLDVGCRDGLFSFEVEKRGERSYRDRQRSLPWCYRISHPALPIKGEDAPAKCL